MSEIDHVLPIGSDPIGKGKRTSHQTSQPTGPIGVFDSGVGGLTVLKEIWQQLPTEEIIYLADNARLPYGSKSRDEILQYNFEIHRFLASKHCKLIIMACNTSSSLALTEMREHFPMPIIGLIEPGAQAALAATQTQRIGVIATKATVQSGSYPAAIHGDAPGAHVFSQACPLFVPLIEAGFFKTEETRRVATEYLSPLQAEGIDTLILGCTHYPHLAPLLQEILGPSVQLVDPAEATVTAAKKVLTDQQLENRSAAMPHYSTPHSSPHPHQSPTTRQGTTHFFVTHSLGAFHDLGEKILGKPIQDLHSATLQSS